MYFFTADEHFGHSNIIKYCKRPFANVKEMDEVIIEKFNDKVCCNDITIHAGDFSFKSKTRVEEYIKQLQGYHIFLKGSHDRWLKESGRWIWEKIIDRQHITVCHYAMRTWSRSHYNSWQLFGHSHGELSPIGKQWDIGVDNNNFQPLSFQQIKSIMKYRPDNFNFIKK